MTYRNTWRGFTLIELLVVVLIIGILAAIALPQYQKAVTRARNAELKEAIRVTVEAARVYYLEHGEYPVDFNQLDINFPLTPIKTQGKTGVCNLTTSGTDSGRQGKDYYMVLNVGTHDGGFASVVAYWQKGKYKCAGFGQSIMDKKNGLNNLHCRESKQKHMYSAGPGDFCEKIEHGTEFNGQDSYWRTYKLP